MVMNGDEIQSLLDKIAQRDEFIACQAAETIVLKQTIDALCRRSNYLCTVLWTTLTGNHLPTRFTSTLPLGRTWQKQSANRLVSPGCHRQR